MPEHRSPAFSSFRELMDKWDESVKKERKTKLKDILPSMLFFFSKDNEFFGGPEEARLMFAKLKTPEDKDIPDDGGFVAMNLSQALHHDEIPKRIFARKDLDGIQVMDKSDLEKLLLGDQ